MFSNYKNINEYSEKIKRLNEWKEGKIAKPYKMIIFPTYNCNLNCSYCPFSIARRSEDFKNLKELSKEEWLEVVKEGIKNKIREWRIFGGGEPMLRSDVTMEIIRFVKNYDINIDCEIITNGTLFKKENIEELVRKRLDRILFSIDGPNAEIHDILRCTPGAFKRATNTINFFSDMKKRYESTKPEIKVNMVINKLNYNKIPEMVKLMHSIGCDELALHPMRIYEKSVRVDKLSLDPKKNLLLNKNIEKAEKISLKIGFKLNTDMVKFSKEKNIKTQRQEKITKNNFLSSICFEPFYTIFVDPEGNTAPCNGYGKGYSTHNITKMNLEDIWFSNLFNSIRKRMNEKKPLESCLKCGLMDMTENLRRNLIEYVKS
jgi:radical SAM protein with 4Fe4S-binding SPASM domain